MYAYLGAAHRMVLMIESSPVNLDTTPLQQEAFGILFSLVAWKKMKRTLILLFSTHCGQLYLFWLLYSQYFGCCTLQPSSSAFFFLLYSVIFWEIRT